MGADPHMHELKFMYNNISEGGRNKSVWGVAFSVLLPTLWPTIPLECKPWVLKSTFKTFSSPC